MSETTSSETPEWVTRNLETMNHTHRYSSYLLDLKQRNWAYAPRHRYPGRTYVEKKVVEIHTDGFV